MSDIQNRKSFEVINLDRTKSIILSEFESCEYKSKLNINTDTDFFDVLLEKNYENMTKRLGQWIWHNSIGMERSIIDAIVDTTALSFYSIYKMVNEESEAFYPRYFISLFIRQLLLPSENMDEYLEVVVPDADIRENCVGLYEAIKNNYYKESSVAISKFILEDYKKIRGVSMAAQILNLTYEEQTTIAEKKQLARYHKASFLNEEESYEEVVIEWE